MIAFFRIMPDSWDIAWDAPPETVANQGSQESPYPIGSMYSIFTYIYHKNQPNVGKYTIDGWYWY